MANLKVSEQAYPTTRYTEAAAPATPAAGEVVIYAKADGNLYQKDDAGTETLLANAASGAVGTDAIWDAKGDLAAGTGANTASKLTVGSNDTILMADSAQSTGLKWVASQTPSTQAFGDAAAEGTADTYARGDHKHAMPANPGGGGLVLLEQHTASASATLDFTTFISSTYDEYMIELNAVRNATDVQALWMRMGTGGGPTYDTGNNYAWHGSVFRAGGSANAGAESAASKIQLGFSTDVKNTAAFGGVSGTLRLYAPQSTTLNKRVVGQIVNLDNSGFNVYSLAQGIYLSATAVTAIRFLYASGNIADGTIRIYGIAK